MNELSVGSLLSLWNGMYLTYASDALCPVIANRFIFLCTVGYHCLFLVAEQYTYVHAPFTCSCRPFGIGFLFKCVHRLVRFANISHFFDALSAQKCQDAVARCHLIAPSEGGLPGILAMRRPKVN